MDDDLGVIYKKAISVYKNNFQYVDSKHIEYNHQLKCLKARVLFLEDTYLKEHRTWCLNNTESIFVINQLMYLIFYSYVSQEGQIEKGKTLKTYIDETVANIIVAENNVKYLKPVFPIEKNGNYTTAVIRISDIQNSERHLRMSLSGCIGVEEEFVFGMVVFLLYHKNIHGSLKST